MWSEGRGEIHSSSHFSPLLSTGAPPTALMASVTKQNASLSWQPPLYDASLLYYIVQYQETRENGFVYSTISTNSTSLELSELDEGTAHRFVVSGSFQGGVVGENATLLVTTLEDGEGVWPGTIVSQTD